MEPGQQTPETRGDQELLPALRPRQPGGWVAGARRPRGVAGASDRGRTREQNEDAFLVADLTRRLRVRAASVPGGAVTPELEAAGATLLAVADGLGGEVGGEIASAVAVDALAASAVGALPWIAPGDRGEPQEMGAALREAFDHCGARVGRAAAALGADYARMGTTLTAALVVWPNAFVAHVGDSRCYLLRDGRLRQLTRDHTLAQQLVDRQIMDPREAERSPLGNVLVNAIGGGTEQLDVDCCEIDLAETDALLLCSDGLTRYVGADAIAREIAAADGDEAGDRNAYCQRCCERLIELANDAGGADNVTVVMAAM